MSTDWNIRCVDCGVTEHFNDANHADDLMRALIAAAPAIAALAPLLRGNDVRLTTYYGDVDADFFVQHAGHKLQPIDEYGRLDDQCHNSIKCDCGYSRACVLKLKHEGDCSPVLP